MSVALEIMLGLMGTPAKVYVEDVFCITTYLGTGGTQNIVNGLDLATKGGLVWTKKRDAIVSHRLNYTNISGYNLQTDTTNPKTANSGDFTGFNSDGYTLPAPSATNDFNQSGQEYVSWSCLNASRFFTHGTVVKSSGSNATVDLSSLGTIGMVKVKCISATSNWYVWHRSLTSGKLLLGNTQDAETTAGHITVVGTTLTLVDSIIANGDWQYEAYAHDTGSDGLIQCGTFVQSSGTSQNISLDWEAQYVMWKRTDNTDTWRISDSIRAMGFCDGAISNQNQLYADRTAVEEISGDYIGAQVDGFTSGASSSAGVYAFVAIRAPMKVPTNATKVYTAITRGGTGAAARVTTGFAPDLVLSKYRSNGGTIQVCDKPRGVNMQLVTSGGGAQITSYTDTLVNWLSNGFKLGADSVGGVWNTNAADHCYWALRSAPGFLTLLSYIGNGSNRVESHKLGVTPELWIIKRWNGTANWTIGCSWISNSEYLVLNSTAAKASGATRWNSTSPTVGSFSLGTDATVNASGAKYVAYLFATCLGVSKVGSYIGTGTTKQIDCGFSAGARFVLIKRADSTGNWYVWDSARGIVSGNDSYVLLNSATTEVTSTDYIDPYNAGFEISSSAPADINASGGTFIFLAIA